MTALPRNRGWLWFFAALVVLSVLAVMALIAYNRGQQLTLEEVHAARRLWQQHGPSRYRLAWSRQHGTEPADRYVVHVRRGKVEKLTINGKLQSPHDSHQYAMDWLLALLEDQVKENAQPGRPRTFTRARFDADDGHLLWYVRAPRGEQRVEITVSVLESLAND